MKHDSPSENHLNKLLIVFFVLFFSLNKWEFCCCEVSLCKCKLIYKSGESFSSLSPFYTNIVLLVEHRIHRLHILNTVCASELDD